MGKNTKSHRSFCQETGSVLVMVAFSMVVLLAASALAIDLANLYMARAQAQRAADAAALAGAKAFVTSGCTSGGCTTGGIQETMATQQAVAAAAQNNIAGQTATINTSSGIAFSYPTAEEPQITVTAEASIPTFFAKIFGIQSVNVSAKATAEAYNPAGGGSASIGVSCLKPFLVPNCDPDHTSPGNSVCADSSGGGNGNGKGKGKGGGGGGGTPEGYFFDPSTGAIAHSGTYPAGIIGMPWQLHTTAAPSQWYLVGFDDAPPSSGSALRDHIVECTSKVFTCGNSLTTANGAKEGPVRQGIEDLINAGGNGLGQGQDSIDTSIGPPFAITGGSRNPNPALRGKVFYDYSESPSVATVPVYSGEPLSPGGSVVDIVGYLQVFITQAESPSQKAIDVVILNATSCGGTPGGGGGGGGVTPIVAAGGSPIPIRLIRTN
ncbi:MAG: pilus assembly protein TadG-related protein [Terriglobia bacterium]|jgi:hypothetical protein